MKIHLSSFDVAALCDAAVQSLDLNDEGELFAEEGFGCFGEEELEILEANVDVTVEDLLFDIWGRWDGEDPLDVIILMQDTLATHDVDLTYDEPEEDDEEDAWEDDDVEMEEFDSDEF